MTSMMQLMKPRVSYIANSRIYQQLDMKLHIDCMPLGSS